MNQLEVCSERNGLIVQDQPSNNEFISLYKNVIVYRDRYSTQVYKVIDKIQHTERCRLILVRQFGFQLQLLWVGGVPMNLIVKRSRRPEIVVGKDVYVVVNSITIMEDE